ncbi:hypothetical protein [Thomasclavelia ramosa]|uniref:hypothetical protein n=2 Tax=Thomasclavelia ramosa TaxID=1547 RepID=UPI001D06F6CD|nr:hypothetical protein [Thomasclavelia ramosa]MCB6436546.1 hypothetical protein [Thomasclavelia ramosa]MCB6459561.1 hypothetical protein [Thomasclavelia ramosa]MCB6601410.1 hypothetical protein [Thomasclavelia ramosa]MCQ5307278.1 hypothetical protein [Thomasclavelia ramosa]MCQ5326488.1 hypothetical protein [Thomasclavelia ramosa]
MSNSKYQEAFDLIDIFTSCGCNEVDDCNCCIAYDKRLKQQHGCELDLALNMFKELIDEHFEPKENTSEFKHFKLHSDSTLKNQTKKELIDYIKMLYHNWGACDEQLKRVIDKAKELSDSNDELRRQLYFIEPYKFEDLKPNMWVYDGIEKLICQIGLISKNAIHREYVDGTISDSPFEEKRFFPVQCANLES